MLFSKRMGSFAHSFDVKQKWIVMQVPFMEESFDIGWSVITRGTCLTSCTQDFYFIYLQEKLCLWAALWENGWTDFHDILRKVWTWDKEHSGIFSASFC